MRRARQASDRGGATRNTTPPNPAPTTPPLGSITDEHWTRFPSGRSNASGRNVSPSSSDTRNKCRCSQGSCLFATMTMWLPRTCNPKKRDSGEHSLAGLWLGRIDAKRFVTDAFPRAVARLAPELRTAGDQRPIRRGHERQHARIEAARRWLEIGDEGHPVPAHGRLLARPLLRRFGRGLAVSCKPLRHLGRSLAGEQPIHDRRELGCGHEANQRCDERRD